MLLKIVNYDAIYNYIYVLKISFGLIWQENIVKRQKNIDPKVMSQTV